MLNITNNYYFQLIFFYKKHVRTLLEYKKFFRLIRNKLKTLWKSYDSVFLKQVKSNRRYVVFL